MPIQCRRARMRVSVCPRARARVCERGRGRGGGESRTDNLALSKYLIISRRQRPRGKQKETPVYIVVLLCSCTRVFCGQARCVSRGHRDGLSFAKAVKDTTRMVSSPFERFNWIFDKRKYSETTIRFILA